MVVSLRYIKKVSDIRYRFKTSITTSLKDKNKAHAKNREKMASDSKKLNRT